MCPPSYHHSVSVVTLTFGHALRASCAQVHKLPQCYCGDNREDTLFLWLHIYYTHLALGVAAHCVSWITYDHLQSVEDNTSKHFLEMYFFFCHLDTLQYIKAVRLILDRACHKRFSYLSSEDEIVWLWDLIVYCFIFVCVYIQNFAIFSCFDR